MIPLDPGDAFVALTFPLGDRVLFIPGVKQLGLLAGKVVVVTIAPIEVCAVHKVAAATLCTASGTVAKVSMASAV